MTALILAALLCLTNAAHVAAPTEPTNYDDLTGHAGDCDGQP